MHKKSFTAFYLAMTVVVSGTMAEKYIVNNIDLSLYETAESILEDCFPARDITKEIYGYTNKVISGTELLTDNYLYRKETDGHLARTAKNYIYPTLYFDNLKQLSDFCKENNTDFAYISYPARVDNIPIHRPDNPSSNPRNDMLEWAVQNNIPSLDVQKMLEEDGCNVHDLFYKTDHHWKAEAGFRTAGYISGFLSQTFGYDTDTEVLDSSLFTMKTYPDIWFGEIGRLPSYTWVDALDDFTMITPDYETSFTIRTRENDPVSTDFSWFISEDNIQTDKKNLYTWSAHYAYNGGDSLTQIHNNNATGNVKVLLIKDSFSVVVIPFLSLAVSDLTVWDIRTDPEGLYDYIKQNDFDCVLLAYTDFWKKHMWDFK